MFFERKIFRSVPNVTSHVRAQKIRMGRTTQLNISVCTNSWLNILYLKFIEYSLLLLNYSITIITYLPIYLIRFLLIPEHLHRQFSQSLQDSIYKEVV